jgi:hypothetical protein
MTVRYLTTTQAAQVLGVDRHSITKMVGSGAIDPKYVYRVGTRGDIRIHPDAFTPNIAPGREELIALADQIRAGLTALEEGMKWAS